MPPKKKIKVSPYFSSNVKLSISSKENEKSNANEKPRQDTCTICLDQIQDEAAIACVHRFCFRCIKAWADVTNLCPLCKKKFSSIRKLHVQKQEIVAVEDKAEVGRLNQRLRPKAEATGIHRCEKEASPCEQCRGQHRTACYVAHVLIPRKQTLAKIHLRTGRQMRRCRPFGGTCAQDGDVPKPIHIRVKRLPNHRDVGPILRQAFPSVLSDHSA